MDSKIKFNFPLFKYICETPAEELRNFILAAFRKLERKSVYRHHLGENFLYYEANSAEEYCHRIPILLVAHLDTVPELFNEPPKCIVRSSWYSFETEKIIDNYVYDQEVGLGADDRAGVLAILSLVHAGYYPDILFTLGEETGGAGAQEFTEWCKIDNLCSMGKWNWKCIIELDRQGDGEAVYYGCKNECFQDVIDSFGFSTQKGTFSDVSIICPKLRVAGVNLSIGYFHEHTPKEYLDIAAWERTVGQLEKLLKFFRKNTTSYYSYYDYT